MNETTENPLIYTSKAQCRDCYRCLRGCPVKAIRMKDGQASVDERLCVGCGTCIRNCPQQAKRYRRDLDPVRALVRQNARVAVSLAPSLAALFPDWKARRLPSALRRLGFGFVAETAYGAYLAAQATRQYHMDHAGQSAIVSACPAVVSFIEKYRPELTGRIVPVASPMILHGRSLKERLGPEWKVIFIGPCVAKKAEALRPENNGAIDGVLTFEELIEWFKEERIDLKSCEESNFDQTAVGPSGHYPLPGGALLTAGMPAGLLAARHLAVSGCDELESALDALETDGPPVLVEPMFCRHGCIDGPAIGTPDNLFTRRRRILDYAAGPRQEPVSPPAAVPAPPTGFRADPVHSGETITEDQIRAVLEQTGKSRPEDHLNCGACGYGSCRDKAIAVLRGMAEIEMCIPYMRRQAERRTDRIIETSPNGIVILDRDLRVIDMNKSFRQMFMCSPAFVGHRISELMDPEPYERLAGGEERVERVQRYDAYNLICQQIAYALREEQQFVGIYVNITSSQSSQTKLDSLRSQTVLQAQDLLRHQMDMARQIASFLGESAARGEQLVENLMKLTQDESRPAARKSTLWDIYTSK